MLAAAVHAEASISRSSCVRRHCPSYLSCPPLTRHSRCVDFNVALPSDTPHGSGFCYAPYPCLGSSFRAVLCPSTLVLSPRCHFLSHVVSIAPYLPVDTCTSAITMTTTSMRFYYVYMIRMDCRLSSIDASAFDVDDILLLLGVW